MNWNQDKSLKLTRISIGIFTAILMGMCAGAPWLYRIFIELRAPFLEGKLYWLLATNYATAVPVGSLHCIALFDPHTGALLETYLSKGSTGGCNNFMVGLSRMISISARGGIDIETIVDQLNSSGSCPSYTARRVTRKDTSKGACCPMAVGNALMDMYREMQEELSQKGEKKDSGKVKKAPKPKAVTKREETDKIYCPECGEPLVFEEGCNICKSCGWSKCH